MILKSPKKHVSPDSKRVDSRSKSRQDPTSSRSSISKRVPSSSKTSVIKKSVRKSQLSRRRGKTKRSSKKAKNINPLLIGAAGTLGAAGVYTAGSALWRALFEDDARSKEVVAEVEKGVNAAKENIEYAKEVGAQLIETSKAALEAFIQTNRTIDTINNALDRADEEIATAQTAYLSREQSAIQHIGESAFKETGGDIHSVKTLIKDREDRLLRYQQKEAEQRKSRADNQKLRAEIIAWSRRQQHALVDAIQLMERGNADEALKRFKLLIDRETEKEKKDKGEKSEVGKEKKDSKDRDDDKTEKKEGSLGGIANREKSKYLRLPNSNKGVVAQDARKIADALFNVLNRSDANETDSKKQESNIHTFQKMIEQIHHKLKEQQKADFYKWSKNKGERAKPHYPIDELKDAVAEVVSGAKQFKGGQV